MQNNALHCTSVYVAIINLNLNIGNEGRKADMVISAKQKPDMILVLQGVVS